MDGYLEQGQTTQCADRPGFQLVSSNLGDFCKGNRNLQYMFISGSVNVVPEPGAFSLACLALLGLVLMRKQTVPTKQ